MTKETTEKLACSLTAETAELVPFLPYLLQDLWELGSNPRDMIRLIKTHMPIPKPEQVKILDIACGKGAAAVQIAKSLGVCVHGFDLTADFIEYARQKAEEFNVTSLCRFISADANEIVKTETGYDCVIFGAAGNILGTPPETLNKLCGTIKPGGVILIDESYLPDDFNSGEIKYKNYDYQTRSQWMSLFKDSGLKLVEESPNIEEYNFDADNRVIAARAEELSIKYPEKRAMFEGYVQSQLNECSDLENSLISVTWLLQSVD